jgi:hypothetical protein
VVPAFHRPYRSLANGWGRVAQTSPSTVRSVNLDLSFAWLSTILYLKPLDFAQTHRAGLGLGDGANTPERKDMRITRVEVCGRLALACGTSGTGMSRALTAAQGASCVAGAARSLPSPTAWWKLPGRCATRAARTSGACGGLSMTHVAC